MGKFVVYTSIGSSMLSRARGWFGRREEKRDAECAEKKCENHTGLHGISDSVNQGTLPDSKDYQILVSFLPQLYLRDVGFIVSIEIKEMKDNDFSET